MKKNRLLIIKHGSLGDIFMSLNSVRSIADEYSDITLLSTTSGHKIFEFYKFNFKKIFDNREGLFVSYKILKKIIEYKFDIIIDLQNSQRTSIYFFILRVFSRSILNSTSIFASKRYLKTNLDEHVSFSLENQIKEVGIFSNKLPYHQHQKLIKKQIILVPGSSKAGKKKRWKLNNYLKIIDYLIKKKINIYILGGKDEIELSNLIPSNKYVHNLIDKSPWNIVKKIAIESIVTVSNDTSTMHFISSLGLPVIAIMKDNKYAIRNAPISKGSVVLKNKNIQEIKLQEVVNELSKFI